jgi:hypothetical protein
MPLAAPVTTATLSWNSFMLLLSFPVKTSRFVFREIPSFTGG